MKALLESNQLFSILNTNTFMIVGAILSGALLVWVAILTLAEDRESRIFPLFIAYGLSALICLGIIFSAPVQQYGNYIVDKEYKDEIKDHIRYLEKQNQIASADYRYHFEKGKKGEHRIIIDIELKEENPKGAGFQYEDPNLNKAIQKDIEYNVESAYRIQR